VLLWERHEHFMAALYVGGSVVGAIAGLMLGGSGSCGDAWVNRRDFDVIVRGRRAPPA